MNRAGCIPFAVLFMFTLTLGWAGQASAGTAEEELMATLDQLKSVFETQGLSQEERMKQAQSIVLERLDLAETSARILVRHRDRYLPRFDGFTDAFRRLIERTFLRKIDKVREIQNMAVHNSELHEGAAKVTVSFTLDGDDYRVTFSMHTENGRWKVYNMTKKGLLDFDLIEYYRVQVDRMLGTRSLSFDEMLGEFEKKAAGR